MQKRTSSLAGTVLVASGAVGAGMFALPIISAGMWTFWALLVLTLVWAMNLLATLMLARVNLQYPAGASFDTVVRQELGAGWNSANNIAIWFVMAILLYAYFSASSSIVSHTLAQLNVKQHLSASQASLLFGGFVALLVWTGSDWVVKACGIFLVGMILSFTLSTGSLLLQVDTSTLMHSPSNATSYLWASLPYFVTAFACGGLVPSLVKHYDGASSPVLRSLLYGTLISLVIYSLWLGANFGSIDRNDFAAVVVAGGNIGDLATALQESIATIDLLLMLTVFSNLAVATSFISIGLGLFDFIADRFKLNDSPIDRLKTAALCFAPPAALSYAFPRGFVMAIGYAGIAVLFSFYLIPALMTLRRRSKSLNGVASTTLSVTVVILFAAVVLICKILAIFGLLSIFPNS